MKVLFVCMGNICRSPMAEAILAHRATELGLADRVSVDSAGTSGYHVGEPAHRDTLAVLRKQGIRYNGRARQVRSNDFVEFDQILAMDAMNVRDLRDWRGSDPSRVRQFLDEGVPDPYYGEQDGFEEVFQMLDDGCRRFLDGLQIPRSSGL